VTKAKDQDPESAALLDYGMVDQEDWAAVQARMVQRDTLKIQTQADAEAQHRRLRHERWDSIWRGVGALLAVALVLTLVLGVGHLISQNSEDTRAKRVLLEREETKQTQACATIEAPIERQYCLQAVGAEE
jgi:cytochrome c-type biogenesis protein CcmH/NrfG